MNLTKLKFLAGNVGAVYLAMGDFDSAVQCHMEHLQIAKRLGNKVEEARAYSNLGKWATNSKYQQSDPFKNIYHIF